MGDSQNDTVRVDFDRKIKLDSHGSTVTSDAGFLVYRELDDALRLTTTAASGLHDICALFVILAAFWGQNRSRNSPRPGREPVARRLPPQHARPSRNRPYGLPTCPPHAPPGYTPPVPAGKGP